MINHPEEGSSYVGWIKSFSKKLIDLAHPKKAFYDSKFSFGDFD